MRIAPVTEVKARFSAYLKVSEEGPVIVTRQGRPVAVLLCLEDEDELDRLVLAYSPKFRKVLEKGRRQIRGGKGKEQGEFWKDTEVAGPK